VLTDWNHGPHRLTCRQTEYTFGLVVDALAGDEPGGLPAGPLQGICDDLLEASVPQECKDTSRSLAVDWTDLESFSRPPPHGTSDCAAVLHALHDFYANSTSLIADAVTRAQQRHRDGHASQRAEHTAILTQIKQKETAIERYFTAFENGTMDDTTACDRLSKLRGEIAQLTARADAIVDSLGTEPAPPPPATIERLQAYLASAITNGTPNERKAAIEALIAEIRITDEGVIPVFRIPGPGTPDPGNDDATSTGAEPVRALVRSVEPRGLEPLTSWLQTRRSSS
jgi:hypothetical protein